METANVVVLDLRDAPCDLPTCLAGGVVVLDSADSLVKHADTYMSLIGAEMVTSVVCVAIGESTADETMAGAVLAVPPALRYATVLWVGDEQGVDWAPRSGAPRPTAGPSNTLDNLVAALRVPAVFDTVIALADELPNAAVNPGIRLVSTAAQPDELAAARATVVQSLCATDHPPSHGLGAAVRQLDAAHDSGGAALAGPVAAVKLDAERRLNHVTGLAATLGTWRALVGRNRPTSQLGRQVVWAGQAAEKYRRYLAELLNRMDGQLQVGHPSTASVVELGVQNPREARGTEIAAGLRQIVDQRLDSDAPLPALIQELRYAAATSSPQGCAAALNEANGHGPLALPMPPFARWPIRLQALPLVLLTCAGVAYAQGPGWLGWLWGALLAAGWFGAGWLLLARRPGPQTEHGFRASMSDAGLYGLAAMLGAIVGAAVPDLWSIASLISQFAIVAGFLVAAGTIAASWLLAVRRWRSTLRVTQLLATVNELTRLAEDVIVHEWHPMRRRRTIALAAEEVASGLEEIARTLPDAGNRLFVSTDIEPPIDGLPPVQRPAPPELGRVLRTDLVDVCRGALTPVWPAVEVAGRTAAGTYARRLEGLLGEYGAHVRQHGLMKAPEFTRDLAPREALISRVWSEVPAALAVLRAGADDDMTQLCRSGQLGYLSTVAPPGLARFAPERLRRVLERDSAHQRLAADPGIAWTDGGELVGSLRLLPLRPESVRQMVGGAR
jgi:hypothetical protein